MLCCVEQQDLFKEKIQRVSLRICFPEYRGADVFDEASEYIKARFLEVNRQEKMVFAHLTCATDTNNVERVRICLVWCSHLLQVFEACKLVILKGNLEKLGLGACALGCFSHWLVQDDESYECVGRFCTYCGVCEWELESDCIL